jgi:hypothetical protein
MPITIEIMVLSEIFGLRVFNPSTAEVTLIAGVINPSAINVQQPIMAGKITHSALYLLTSA